MGEIRRALLLNLYWLEIRTGEGHLNLYPVRIRTWHVGVQERVSGTDPLATNRNRRLFKNEWASFKWLRGRPSDELLMWFIAA